MTGWFSGLSQRTPGWPLVVAVPPGSTGPELLSGWPPALPGVDVAIVQLPGRGARLFETPVASMTDLADDLAEQLLPLVGDRWVLAGHCSGSYLALEVAHRMVSAQRSPHRLVLSGSRPPDGLADPASEQSRAVAELLSLSDSDLGHRLGATGSTVDPEVLAAVLAAYRAAVLASAGYRHSHEPVDVPVEVWRGDQDDVVGEQDAMGWSAYSATEPAQVVFAGRREYFEQPQAAAAERVARMFEPEEST